MNNSRRTLFTLFIGLLMLAGVASAASIHVIERTNAESLVPVIRPLLGENGYVNAYKGRLVIRADDKVFLRIQTVLEQLPDHSRTITVHLRRKERGSSRGSGLLRADDGINLSAGVSHHHSQSVYRITTLGGHGAHIAQGSLVALIGGYDPVPAQLQQGIWVIPEVTASGQVRLSIRQRFDEFKNNGRVTTQGAATTLLLTPGQWRSLGQIRVRGHSENAGLAGAGAQVHTMKLPLQVKVELHQRD